jgi:hypothetical protein
MEHASHSDHLSFVPQPVDASFPPFSVISSTTAGDKKAAAELGFVGDGRKVLRLFCLSFHHFNDETARRVIKSTLETSDAFAIIELQDRRLASVIIMLLEPWLLFLVTALWFWHDRLQLFLTYAVPVLPFLHLFDGLVSCLRTRSFNETVALVDQVQGHISAGRPAKRSNARCGDWMLSHSRQMHTWPLGYMDVTFGKKVAT